MTEPAFGLSGRLALGRYRVVKELARGGMGMVYLGRVEGAAGFSKPVVIKRVLSHVDDNKSARSQFIREARLLSELQHPNIVGVIDFGEEEDGYLMILEYVHGFHVGLWLRYVLGRGQRFHWEFATLIVIKVLAALHYAHNRIGPDGKKSPIIHRDVSPGNVLIDLQGNVRLLDFGIARSSDDEEAKTQNGVVKGKLPYIAPEIYRSAEASVVSDVYSSGVMLYQLLSGKNPFSAQDMSTIIGRVLEHTPPAISTLRSDLPPAMDAVLFKAIDKDPKRRYQSAQEFAAALAGLLTCSEGELAEEMQAAVAIEFSDEMARVLAVPALSILDAAWRAAADDPDAVESLQRSSLPPSETTRTAVTGAIPVLSPLPRSLHEVETLVAPITARAHADRMREISRVSEIGAQAVPTLPAPRGPQAAPPFEHTTGATPDLQGRRSMVAILVGAAVVATAVLGAALLLRPALEEPGSKAPRFLVVERPTSNTPSAETQHNDQGSLSDATANAPAGTSPTGTSAQPTSSPLPPPKVAAHKGTSAPSDLSDAQRVTAAFGARQGAVQACFSKSSTTIKGAPQLSVRFKIGPTGAVQAASISPASVSGTALGSCLLGVAQATKFPALGKELGFSIPITAQVVNR